MQKINIGANRNFTKRDIISQIARIYDPLSLLGPVIAKEKNFKQHLWLLKLEWTKKLSPHVFQLWENFIGTLLELE